MSPCPSCGTTTELFGSGGGERLAADLKLPFLGPLPLDPKVMEAGEDGSPLEAGTSSEEYKRIAASVATALDHADAGVPSFRWDWSDDRSAPDWTDGETIESGSRNVPVGMRRSGERTLSILWGDGVRQDIDVRDLRLSCGCALCKEEMSGRPLVDPDQVSLDVHPVQLWNVGNYALGLRWSDGHASGIHPFSVIRAMARKRPIDRLSV